MTSEPVTTRPKRQVSYNQQAILCPHCTKRIRLNNSGRLRVHISGKVGSDRCVGSNSPIPVAVSERIDTFLDDPSTGAIRVRPNPISLFSNAE